VTLPISSSAPYINGMRKYLVIVPLLALLALSIYFAIFSWSAIEGPPVPAEGHFAMWLGIVFSLLVGCGLMALAFYSSRTGHDDAAATYTDDPKRPL
jgi:hypothetical protein